MWMVPTHYGSVSPQGRWSWGALQTRLMNKSEGSCFSSFLSSCLRFLDDARMCGRQPDKPFLSQAALVTVFITAEGSLRKRGGHWTLFFVLFDLLTKLSVFQQGFGNVLVWFCLVYFAREILSLSNVNLHKSFFFFLQRLIFQHFKTLKYSLLPQFLRTCFTIKKPYLQQKSKSQRGSVHW